MKITYDGQADALYISLSSADCAVQRHVTEDCIVDIDKDGNVVGIEILGAKATYGNDVTTLKCDMEVGKI